MIKPTINGGRAEQGNHISGTKNTRPEIKGKAEDWEIVDLQEIVEVKGGGTPSKGNKDYWNGEIPWASVKDLTGFWKEKTQDFITKRGLEDSSANLIPKNSVIISTRMTVGEPFINLTSMAINQDLKGLIPDRSRVNPGFLLYALWGKDTFLKSLGRGTTVSGITTNDLKRLKFAVPKLTEQRRIASVLYNVDQAIQKTEEIIEQTRRVKKGLMQDLFTEGYYNHENFKETKYGKVPSSWKVSKISEIANNVQAGGTPNTGKKEYYGGDIPWVKTGELKQDVVKNTEQTITEKGLENSTARKFPENTVLVAMYGATTGEISRLGIEAATNQACCGIQVNEKIDSCFLHQQLEYFNDNLIALSAGSGQQNIRKSTIVNFDVLVPAKEEQEEISDTLRNVQNKLNKYEQVKTQLQRLKKGLMQDLLTGKVRTKDKNIDVLDEVLEVEKS